jgi:hypothetical protein
MQNHDLRRRWREERKLCPAGHWLRMIEHGQSNSSRCSSSFEVRSLRVDLALIMTILRHLIISSACPFAHANPKALLASAITSASILFWPHQIEMSVFGVEISYKIYNRLQYSLSLRFSRADRLLLLSSSIVIGSLASYIPPSLTVISIAKLLSALSGPSQTTTPEED